MLNPASVYARRRLGIVASAAVPADLPPLIDAMETALATKDAAKIATAAAPLTAWGTANPEGTTGHLAAALGIAGETAPDLASLDDLVTAATALIAILRTVTKGAAGTDPAATATARARAILARAKR